MKFRKSLRTAIGAAAFFVALMFGFTISFAADVNKGKGSTKADDYLPQVAATSAKPWSGLRVYGDLGYLVQRQHTVDNDGLIQFDVSTALDAATYGGGLGIDAQLSNHWVVGAFADISWTNKDQTFSIPTKNGTVVGDADIENMITVGGRLGYLFTPKVMGYVLGGYTWVDADTSSFFDSSKDFLDDETDSFGSRGGWTVGLGTEAFVADRWTLSLEYRFTRLDGGTLQWAAPETAVADVDTDLHRIIARLGYHF